MADRKNENIKPDEGKPTPETKSEAEHVKDWATKEFKKLKDRVAELERQMKL